MEMATTYDMEIMEIYRHVLESKKKKIVLIECCVLLSAIVFAASTLFIFNNSGFRASGVVPDNRHDFAL
jgi:hypothetical protein